MEHYTTRILKFSEKGEKTSWTYIEVPADIAGKLKPGNRKSFRVKGRLDKYAIEKIALLPIGDGNFIIPLNANMRKSLGKVEGAMLQVELDIDNRELLINAEFLECLNDDPSAMDFFNSLPRSHQNYFSKWIDSAKTEPTKVKRIAQAVTAMSRKQSYSEMMRSLKKNLL